MSKRVNPNYLFVLFKKINSIIQILIKFTCNLYFVIKTEVLSIFLIFVSIIITNNLLKVYYLAIIEKHKLLKILMQL